MKIRNPFLISLLNFTSQWPIVKKYILFSHIPNKKPYPITQTRASLSLSRGLLDEVAPSLRSASIKWDQDLIHLFFFYDGDISEEDEESAHCVATEVISSFPEHDLKVDIIRRDFPQPIPNKGDLVFKRREKVGQNEKAIKILREDTSTSQEACPLSRATVMISLMQGLLGEISPALREASVTWDENFIQLFFFYDREISDEDHISAHYVASQVKRDFPKQDLKIDIIRLDFPQAFPKKERAVVYSRREQR